MDASFVACLRLVVKLTKAVLLTNLSPIDQAVLKEPKTSVASYPIELYFLLIRPRLVTVHSPDYLALPLVSRGQFFGWLDANFGVPLARWKHSHLIQELIDACNQVLSVPGLIRDIAKELEMTLAELLCWIVFFNCILD